MVELIDSGDVTEVQVGVDFRCHLLDAPFDRENHLYRHFFKKKIEQYRETLEKVNEEPLTAIFADLIASDWAFNKAAEMSLVQRWESEDDSEQFAIHRLNGTHRRLIESALAFKRLNQGQPESDEYYEDEINISPEKYAKFLAGEDEAIAAANKRGC